MDVCRGYIPPTQSDGSTVHYIVDALTLPRQCPAMFAGDLNVDMGKTRKHK
jgi:hypothetical protein